MLKKSATEHSILFTQSHKGSGGSLPEADTSEGKESAILLLDHFSALTSAPYYTWPPTRQPSVDF